MTLYFITGFFIFAAEIAVRIHLGLPMGFRVLLGCLGILVVWPASLVGLALSLHPRTRVWFARFIYRASEWENKHFSWLDRLDEKGKL